MRKRHRMTSLKRPPLSPLGSPAFVCRCGPQVQNQPANPRRRTKRKKSKENPTKHQNRKQTGASLVYGSVRFRQYWYSWKESDDLHTDRLICIWRRFRSCSAASYRTCTLCRPNRRRGLFSEPKGPSFAYQDGQFAYGWYGSGRRVASYLLY